jgi:hypothetical protein
LRDEWWQGEPETVSEAHLRRGSAVLHLLLVQGLAGRAWRALGFSGEPSLDGPDIDGIAAKQGIPMHRIVSMIAGGGRLRGIDAAFIGAIRVDNSTTGVSADADEGFAVVVTTISRDARGPTAPSDLDSLVNRTHRITGYLNAAGAVRRGSVITRREVIDYFRNEIGGAHHDAATGSSHAKTSGRHLLAELERKVIADVREGLHFEILSIGQSVARSADFLNLAAAIRRSET